MSRVRQLFLVCACALPLIYSSTNRANAADSETGFVRVDNQTDHAFEISIVAFSIGDLKSETPIKKWVTPYETTYLRLPSGYGLKASRVRYQLNTFDKTNKFSIVGTMPGKTDYWEAKYDKEHKEIRIDVTRASIKTLPRKDANVGKIWIVNKSGRLVDLESIRFVDQYGQYHDLPFSWNCPIGDDDDLNHKDKPAFVGSELSVNIVTTDGARALRSSEIVNGRLLLNIVKDDLPIPLRVDGTVATTDPELLSIIQRCYWMENEFRQEQIDKIKSLESDDKMTVWDFWAMILKDRSISESRFSALSNPYGVPESTAKEFLGRIFLKNDSKHLVVFRLLSWKDHKDLVLNKRPEAGWAISARGGDYARTPDSKLIVAYSAQYRIETQNGTLVKEGTITSADEGEPNRIIESNGPELVFGQGKKIEIVATD
ncbi:MAG: hypothetical protein HYV60_12590, partial [Planctomycetia bacterium]|nr:hypothetical protein [Planctomycetia bacterium]